MAQAAWVLSRMAAEWAKHDEHPWHKVGRCVYCGPCGVRLFQGGIPKDHPIYKSPRSTKPDTAEEMLRLRKERYGQ